jgi:predicted TPR repeat methyltransferase
MQLDPARAPGIFSRLVLAGFSDEQIAAAVPSSPAALLMFARYTSTTGDQRLAEAAYRRTLALDPGNQQATAGLKALGQDR